MSYITTANKSSGDPHTAVEYNAFKAAINSKKDHAAPLEVTSSGSTTVTFPSAYISGSIRYFKNGIRQKSTSFSEATTTTITLTTTPDNGDDLIFEYNV